MTHSSFVFLVIAEDGPSHEHRTRLRAGTVDALLRGTLGGQPEPIPIGRTDLYAWRDANAGPSDRPTNPVASRLVAHLGGDPRRLTGPIAVTGRRGATPISLTAAQLDALQSTLATDRRSTTAGRGPLPIPAQLISTADPSVATCDTLRLTSADDVVVAVPYILGFHPADSVVCIVLDQQRVRLVVRFDLPQSTQLHQLSAPATKAAALIARHGSAAMILGYGPADRVEPAADALAVALDDAAVEVLEMLRVADGRYWCLCGNPVCASGVAYDAQTSPVQAAAVYLGIAPLPDRAALENLIAPVTGPERDRMHAATSAALLRLTQLQADSVAPAADGRPARPKQVVRAGNTAVQQAYESAARGETLSDEDVAWLAALLMVTAVRDRAWSACDGSDAHRRLWIDVTRRAVPPTGAAPACLLAFTAYLGGDGALANVAVDRSLRVDPDYRLARLFSKAMRRGVPPEQCRPGPNGETTD
jgi:hypothetical protein